MTIARPREAFKEEDEVASSSVSPDPTPVASSNVDVDLASGEAAVAEKEAAIVGPSRARNRIVFRLG